MRIDASRLDRAAAHDLLKGCVVPRPVAWISTLGPGGVANAAPYSCFTFLATQPPMVCFCAEPRANGQEKDTLRNCRNSGDFVVNVVSEDLAEAMNQTAADYPPQTSELEAVGMASCPSERVRSPRIAQSPISLECRVRQILPMGQSGQRSQSPHESGLGGLHQLVIGEVLLFHIRDDLYRDGQIDQHRLRPLARLAGNQYARLGEIFELGRPWLRETNPVS